MPIKRVRLVIHIFQKDDGSGNIPDDSNGRSFLTSIYNHFSWFYIQPDTMKPHPADKPYTPVPDTRIRFVIDTILFHRNTDDWNFRHYTGYYNEAKKDTLFSESAAWDRSDYLYKKYVTNNGDLPVRMRDSALHLFFLEAASFQNRGMSAGLYTCKWVYFVGAYFDMQHGRNHWDPGYTMAHEMGHAMGLTHPFDGGNVCTDLPYTPRGKTNNVMDGWPGGGRGWTPQQVALVHYSLSGGEGNMHNALIRDWDTYHPDSAMHILNGDSIVWNCRQFLVGDLVLDKVSSLTINCTVNMPPGAAIMIKPGARLTVNGQVTTDGNYTWQGVKIESAKRFLFFGKEHRGKMILNGTLTHVGQAKSTKR